jgi:hypothetical protein
LRRVHDLLVAPGPPPDVASSDAPHTDATVVPLAGDGADDAARYSPPQPHSALSSSSRSGSS